MIYASYMPILLEVLLGSFISTGSTDDWLFVSFFIHIDINFFCMVETVYLRISIYQQCFRRIYTLCVIAVTM